MNINKLQKLVSESKLNKVQIAELCGFTRVTLDNALQGADIKVSTIESIAKVLGVSASVFFTDDDNDNSLSESSEITRLKNEIEKLNKQLQKKMTTKVIVELDVDSDEFVKMGLKERIVQVLKNG